MELHGRSVRLRPVSEDDAGALTAILADPDVARWWPNYDAARVDAEIVGEDRGQGSRIILTDRSKSDGSTV